MLTGKEIVTELKAIEMYLRRRYCACKGVPPFQPCGMGCDYPYQDQRPPIYPAEMLGHLARKVADAN